MTDDQALDRLIDALNAGRLDPAAIDEPELAELLALARDLRRLGPSAPAPVTEWPAADFPRQLAQGLAAALRPAPRPLPPPSLLDSGDAAPPLPVLNGHAHMDTQLATVTERGPARRWLREGLRLAAAGVALVLLTGLLVALLHDRGGQSAHIGSAGGQGSRPAVTAPGTPSGTPGPAPRSIWAFDPDAAEAHQLGLGQPLQLSQQANGYTVTLEWAYSDGRQVYLVYRISAPPGQTYNSFGLWKAELIDAAGTMLPARGGGGTAVIDGSAEMLTRFDAGQVERQGGSLRLHFSALALQVIVPNPGAATPTASTQPPASVPGTPVSAVAAAKPLEIPVGPDGLPESVCDPGEPVCFTTVRGPFSFDFSVPVRSSDTEEATPEPPNAAAPTPVIPTPPPLMTVRDAGAWKLIYATYDGQPAAGVQYDARTREGILAYRDAVRQLGANAFAHHDQVPALVTFNHPLSTEEFAALIHDSGATAKSYRYRTVDASGVRGTMGFAPGQNGEISGPDNPTATSGAPYNVHGVFDAEVVIDADAYARLSQDANVFLTDVMRAVADDTLRQQGLAAPSLDDISLTAPYWTMEDTGLVKIP